MTPTPDWSPFAIAAPDEKPQAPRAIHLRDGVGDRLRAAAFAEIQAREAFLWAAERFAGEAPDTLRAAWREFAAVENKHLGWLLKRMAELGFEIRERRVADTLWQSLMSCHSARDFAHYIASAEERGRRAGVRFHEALLQSDPVTAEIFGKIAEEEVEHIATAAKFYPEGPPSLNERLSGTSIAVQA